MFAHNPLHGSGQTGFPHPALTLGNDAHAAQGIGMTDDRQRQPASDEAPHTTFSFATPRRFSRRTRRDNHEVHDDCEG
jgi:hypothetical protein